MTEYTPGPWKAVPRTHSVGICHGGGDGYLDRLAECCFWSPKRVNQPDRNEAEANARLIAAAPELLKAAQVALEVLTSMTPHDIGAKDMLRQAIAKAEGK